jgi:hypothetical protein
MKTMYYFTPQKVMTKRIGLLNGKLDPMLEILTNVGIVKTNSYKLILISFVNLMKGFHQF